VINSKIRIPKPEIRINAEVRMTKIRVPILRSEFGFRH